MLQDSSHLLDILKNACLIQEFVAGLDQEGFERNIKDQYAVVRGIEIIGEAVKRLSPEFRKEHDEIPWRNMAGMRDVIIHDYDKVDYGEVWKVAQNDIPMLIAQIELLVPPRSKEGL